MRDQRLKAYVELTQVVEEFSEAFTLMAATLSLRNYDWEQLEIEKPKIRTLLANWNAGVEKLEKAVTAAELVVSDELYPTVVACRFAHHRQSMLLMQFSHMREMNPEEWKSIENVAHRKPLELRAAFRRDIHGTLNPRSMSSRRFRRLRRRFSLARRGESRRFVRGSGARGR
ncbi:hypothetical protein [Nocardia farcinica]|uniref:hypothetical protein n=1 Tax=Nocardia farcinica TaxID=37329 RepID=UPI002458764A|nr:hypothetical protein [Nocardia farcinica]